MRRHPFICVARFARRATDFATISNFGRKQQRLLC